MKRPLRVLTWICALGVLSGCSSVRLPDVFAGSNGTAAASEVLAELEAQEPVFQDGTPAVLWGRDQLDEHAQAAYDAMSLAIACRWEEPLEVEADSEEIELVLRALRIDHPEYFWFDGEASFVSTELAGITVSTECTFVYTMDREQIAQAAQQVQQYTEDCLSSPEMAAAQSDYEKILGVYRYLINNTDYVAEDGDQSILGLMTNHQGACAGYARSFQYLMNKLGIPCTLALGTGTSGQSHGWNIVQCEGAWYQMDVTWGDPVTPEGTPGNSLQYTYCMVTDEEIYRDHTPDPDIPMPRCTDTTWNYFIHEGLQFDIWDAETYETALSAAVERGDSYYIVRYSKEESYRSALKALFDESRIMDMLMRCNVLEATGEQYVTYTQNDLFFEISVLLA